MKLQVRAGINRWFLIFCGCLCLSTPAGAQVFPLVPSLFNDYEEVKVRAQAQANNNNLQYQSTRLESKIFEGTYTPSKNQIKLAVLSDDGVDIYINDSLVHQRKGQGQTASSLPQSLHQINYNLVKDQTYRIKIDYNNKYYSGSDCRSP